MSKCSYADLASWAAAVCIRQGKFPPVLSTIWRASWAWQISPIVEVCCTWSSELLSQLSLPSSSHRSCATSSCPPHHPLYCLSPWILAAGFAGTPWSPPVLFRRRSRPFLSSQSSTLHLLYPQGGCPPPLKWAGRNQGRPRPSLELHSLPFLCPSVARRSSPHLHFRCPPPVLTSHSLYSKAAERLY